MKYLRSLSLFSRSHVHRVSGNDELCMRHDRFVEKNYAMQPRTSATASGAQGFEVGSREKYEAATTSLTRGLPAGWEAVEVGGETIFLDHVNRTAHRERPWDVLRRLAAS